MLILFHGGEGLAPQGSQEAEAEGQEQGLHLQSLCSRVCSGSLGRLKMLLWGLAQMPLYCSAQGPQGIWPGELTSPFLVIQAGQFGSGEDKMSSFLDVVREHPQPRG